MTTACLNVSPVFGKAQQKEKTLDEERSVPQSAFLGPTLWDKTLPYDGDGFQLEYMDLEEFLSENGISSSPSHQRQPTVIPQAPPTVMDLSSHASTSGATCLHSSPAPAGEGPGHSCRLVVLQTSLLCWFPTTESFSI